MGDLIPFPPSRDLPPPIRMFCMGCGRERVFYATLGHHGPCECGGSGWQSWQPNLPAVGGVAVTITHDPLHAVSSCPRPFVAV